MSDLVGTQIVVFLSCRLMYMATKKCSKTVSALVPIFDIGMKFAKCEICDSTKLVHARKNIVLQSVVYVTCKA